MDYASRLAEPLGIAAIRFLIQENELRGVFRPHEEQLRKYELHAIPCVIRIVSETGCEINRFRPKRNELVYTS